jgi:hypothetical protein
VSQAIQQVALWMSNPTPDNLELAMMSRTPSTTGSRSKRGSSTSPSQSFHTGVRRARRR